MNTKTIVRSYHPQSKGELIYIIDKCSDVSQLCKALNRSIAWINKVYDSETVKLKMTDKIPQSLCDKLFDYWFKELPSCLSEDEKIRLRFTSQTKLKKSYSTRKRGTKKQSVYDKASIFGVNSIKYYPAGGKKNER